ncbi:MAG: membrane protein insertion efficiency factor YidD [Ruminococcaceae bacterium]|nr:membrane protein insertion efficiency factor YidD [Oscillospiraceae bacterium]
MLTRGRCNRMKRVLLAVIRFYRRHISPHLPPMCRYYPTCSCYAVEAIETHGALKGTLLAAWRVLRCNPFSAGGYDPVPPKKDRHN